MLLTVCPLLSPAFIPALTKTCKAFPTATPNWKGGENSTAVAACPSRSLPVQQEGNLYVERVRYEEETIQIPAMNRLAGTFPAGCCRMVGAPHECPVCPSGLAACTAGLEAWQRAEARGGDWKFLYPSGSTCFQHKIQAARRCSSRWELLHGWSLRSHTDSESQRLTASPQPWHSHGTREDFPCRFTASLCQYSNKPGCNGRNKRSLCHCL